MWLAASFLMVAEFLVFDRMTSRHHAGIFPQWTDQVYYLTDAYLGYEDAKAHGLIHGLRTTLLNTMPQGALHDVAALVIFTVAGGPSRSAALSLNMLAFLLWQAALFHAFARTSGSWALGWMVFGLLPCLAWPWATGAGAAMDFRLDHGAMCLFGTCAAFALLTRGFRSLGWSVALGFVLCLTLLERFLTAVYLGPLFILTAGWVLCGGERGPRLRNLLLAALIAAALAGPVFWWNRALLREYYWVGQVSSAEAAARLPGFTSGQSLQFLYSCLKDQQLGIWFLWTTVAVTVPWLALAMWPRRPVSPKPAPRTDWDWLFFSVVFFLVPALILHLHQQKSHAVLGVLVPGVILLLGWIWSVLWPRAARGAGPGPIGRLCLEAPLLLALFSGALFFAERQVAPPYGPSFSEGARRINWLADYFFDHTRAAHLPVARIGVDQMTDKFDANLMRVISYERKKVWMPYEILLPTGILEVDDHVIMDRLHQCDFVLVTDVPVDAGQWPYDRQMHRLYPTVKAWCEANLRLVETFPAFNGWMTLYQRRDIP